MEPTTYYYLKNFLLSFHIFAWIAWLSALFYISRLFVYRREAQNNNDAPYIIHLKKMETLLAKRIALPAMILTWSAGLALLAVTKSYQQGWFHSKFLFLFLIVLYHHFSAKIRKQETISHSPTYLRFFNEILTVPIAFIVSLSIFKNLTPAFISATLILIIVATIGLVLNRNKSNKKLKN